MIFGDVDDWEEGSGVVGVICDHDKGDKTEKLNCNSSSGGDIRISGTTTLLIAEASSGSDIKASNLKAETSKVKASSGADISVNTSKELTARATSGGDIRYSGNPQTIDKSDSSSGSVRAN